MKTKKAQRELDGLDTQILKELRLNCRRSYRELARVMGISPASVIERIRNLESSGYVLGHKSILNFSKLGYDFAAFVNISISKAGMLEVQEKISRLSGVAAVYDLTGEYDAVAVVMCKSRDELSALLKSIHGIPNVEKTNTQMILNIVKDIHEFDGV